MRLIGACSYLYMAVRRSDVNAQPLRKIFAGLVFDLSHFYAIVADFHTRVRFLFSKLGYSVLMNSHLSRSRAVRAIRRRIKRHAKRSIGKRAQKV